MPDATPAPGLAEARPTLQLIAAGQGAHADAVRLFALLHQVTRDEVQHYLVAHKGRLGTLDPKIHGYAGWAAGEPRGVVIHVPALWGRAALDTVDIARRFMIAGPSPKGTHVVVGWPAGQLLVTAHPKDSAWHTGDPDGKAGPLKDHNRSHLGIDVVSPGPLVPGPGGTWLRWDGKEAPIVRPDGSHLEEHDILDLGGTPVWGHRYWHCPTPGQVLATAVTLRALRLLRPTVRPEAVIRHADVDRNRVDPGPGLPLTALQQWMVDRTDLTALEDELAGGDWRGWHAWLLEQWRDVDGGR